MVKKKTKKVKAERYEYKKIPAWAKTATPEGLKKGVERYKRKLDRYSDIQKIERAKKELYRREHPYETRAKQIAAKGIKGVGRIVSRFAGQRAVSRQLLKKNKIEVRIPEYRNEPYVPIYIKNKIKEDKRNFFLR